MIDTALLDNLAHQATADGIQQFVVGAIVRDGNSALLLQRPSDDFMGGIYELPSGKVEVGESLDTALRREVKEETGLEVTAIETYLGHFDYTSGSGKASRQFNFAVGVASTAPILLTEHDSFQWASVEGGLPVTEAVKGVFNSYRSQQTP